MPITGGRRKEWEGPENPLGAVEMWIYQQGKVVATLLEAQQSGRRFDVVWYYNPSNAEIDAGADGRQRFSERFGSHDSYIKILGAMYALRREKLATLDFYVKGAAIPF